ncbi:hypothetical protein TNCV_4888501 [Trichonephila clavipes]|nr:hypothetical protein TNCV_4888501 [Trichonephila clavipes]
MRIFLRDWMRFPISSFSCDNSIASVTVSLSNIRLVASGAWFRPNQQRSENLDFPMKSTGNHCSRMQKTSCEQLKRTYTSGHLA